MNSVYTIQYNIRKYIINFSGDLETKLMQFEKHYENYVDYIHYKVCKQQFDAIYEEKAKGIKIISKCNWYELGEKSNKSFLNLGKHRAIQSQINSVIINQDEITDQDEINKQIISYQSLFSLQVQNHPGIIEAFLELVTLPKLTNEQTLSCEGIISEDEMFKSLKSMENNKSLGNHGLSKGFHECVWNEIKNYCNCNVGEKKIKTKDSLKTVGRYHCLIPT